MPRDPRAETVARLRRERRTRAVGRFDGPQATADGDVRAGSRQRDTGRIGLALVLLVGLAGVLLYVLACMALGAGGNLLPPHAISASSRPNQIMRPLFGIVVLSPLLCGGTCPVAPSPSATPSD